MKIVAMGLRGRYTILFQNQAKLNLNSSPILRWNSDWHRLLSTWVIPGDAGDCEFIQEQVIAQ